MLALVLGPFVAPDPITGVGELVVEVEDGLDVVNELTDDLVVALWLCAVTVGLRADVGAATVFLAVDVGLMEEELEETAQVLPKPALGVSSDAKVTYPH